MSAPRVPPNLAHFAIHADNVGRARRFYERVFGWRFEPWGPPDFYLISTGSPETPGVQGALQRRMEPATAGGGIRAYECTIAVADLARTAAAIEEAGGRIIVPTVEIPGVGQLVKFEDPEGNVACAMHYDV